MHHTGLVPKLSAELSSIEVRQFLSWVVTLFVVPSWALGYANDMKCVTGREIDLSTLLIVLALARMFQIGNDASRVIGPDCALLERVAS